MSSPSKTRRKASLRQDTPEQNSVQDNSPEELVRLQCEICRSILAILPRPTADRIGERVGYLANGAILPGSGVGDVFTLAAMLGVGPDAVAAQLNKGKLPQLGMGKAILYSIAGFFAKRKES